MKSKMKCTLKLIALMIIFTIIGGCTVKQKAHTKQAQTATPSSIKEDTATPIRLPTSTSTVTTF